MDITERYFKALGWSTLEMVKDGATQILWFPSELGEHEGVLELPNITQHYPDFKKWVLEEMEKEDIVFMIDLMVGRRKTSNAFCMFKKDNLQDHLCHLEIKDNEILEAAVLAATRYMEEKR